MSQNNNEKMYIEVEKYISDFFFWYKNNIFTISIIVRIFIHFFQNKKEFFF